MVIYYNKFLFQVGQVHRSYRTVPRLVPGNQQRQQTAAAPQQPQVVTAPIPDHIIPNGTQPVGQMMIGTNFIRHLYSTLGLQILLFLDVRLRT